MMDRRKFLTSLVGGVTAAAAVRTFPFRVFSFPKEIIAPSLPIPAAVWEQAEFLRDQVRLLTGIWYIDPVLLNSRLEIPAFGFFHPREEGIRLDLPR